MFEIKVKLNELKAGDKVYVVYSGSWSATFTPGVVTKTTPSGLLDVLIGASKNPTRFKKDGYEMGARYHGHHIDTSMTFEEREAQQASNVRAGEAAKALALVKYDISGTPNKEYLTAKVVELQAKLDKARLLIDQI